MDDQSRQVLSDTSQTSNLLGDRLGSLVQPETVTRGKTTGSVRKIERSPSKEFYKIQGTSEPCRNPQLRQFLCPYGQTELSRTVKFTKQYVETETDTSQPFATRRETKLDLVVSKLQTGVGNLHSTTIAFPDHRRLRYSMGSSSEQYVYLRHLDNTRENLTLQPEGTINNPKGLSKSLSAPELQYSFNTKRQLNSCSLSTSRRRNQINRTNEDNLPDFPDFGSSPDPCQNSLYSGHIQLSRRLSVEDATRSRVASPSRMHRKGLLQVGNTGNRSIRLLSSACSDKLCHLGPERQPSVVSRRFIPELELPPGLDISAAIPNPQGVKSPESMSRDLPSGDTSLGQSLLARGPQGTSNSTPVHSLSPRSSPNRHLHEPATTECERYDSRGVEMWGWSDKVTDWNPNQLELLQSAWRPSTRKTYNSAWKKWLSWSQQQNVPSNNPNGSDVARFLSDLYLIHKLSYSSILLHKSVVSTLCDPDKSGVLSSHFMVKQILKSISSQKQTCKKPPIWNVDVLAAYLKSYKVDWENCFQVQRHTAALLLLCSGRRVHDLTLLHIDSDHYTEYADSANFWPVFGSKTDSSNYRQSGWKLLINKDDNNLDPIYCIKKTISLLESRRHMINSTSLFMNLRGEAAPASRTIIAGWIKTLLKDAGISATPGSFRSAVASKNWFDNYPLEDILARGNWRSQNTFCKFYRKEILSNPSTSSSISRLFNPINE